MSSPRARDADRIRVERYLWERTMRRLRISNWLLAALLIALIVRLLIAGAAIAGVLAATTIAAVLLAMLRLTSQGRRLEPPLPPPRPRTDPTANHPSPGAG
jgi:hypothetical protein